MNTPRSFPNAFQRRTQDRLNTQEKPTEYPNAFQRRTQERLDIRERPTEYPGAFQQKRRDDRQYGRSNPAFGQQSYGQWKRHEDPVKPKEVHIESTIDFPSLGGLVATKTVSQQATVSLAEKLKVAIQQEQEQATQRSYRKDTEKYDEIKIPVSLGSLMRRREQEKKEAEETRLDAVAQYEDEEQLSDNDE